MTSRRSTRDAEPERFRAAHRPGRLRARAARALTVALGALALAAAPSAARQAQPQTPPQPVRLPLGLYGGQRTFSLALTGDAVITRRLSSYAEPRFLELMELVRGQDLAFANLEMLFHDYEASPEAQSGNLGTYLRADPGMAAELAWAGIDMLSMADDHVADYGAEGMRLTRKYVEGEGILTAGAGEDLREAREARFVETNDGRVAFVSTSSTFPAHARAGAPRGGVSGRPGLNPLRIVNQGPRPIPAAQLERLRATLAGMGLEVTPAGQPLSAFGVQLAAGEGEWSQRGAPDEADLAEMAGVVKNASELSDYVVMSVHAHNQGAYLQAFAHAMVDAGADVLVGHGPHSLRGIEIYQGKPIFYSLGDFVFQDETILRLPADSYARYGLGADATVADVNVAREGGETSDYESVVAVPTFESGRLVSIELHPITLGADQGPTAKGRPMLAEPAQGQRIIERLAEMSRRFGTVIEWEAARGIGVVRVPRAD